jgi:hypothetical protein
VLPVQGYRIPQVAITDKHGGTEEKRRTMRNAYSSFQFIHHDLGLHPALCGMKLEYIIICLKYIRYKIYAIKKYHRHKHQNGICELKAWVVITAMPKYSSDGLLFKLLHFPHQISVMSIYKHLILVVKPDR